MRFYLTPLFLLLLCTCGRAQRMVYGTVLDAQDSQPLIGANVLVEGTNRGTVANLDGLFRLSVAEKDVLVVNYIGYTSRRILAAEIRDSITIVLEPNATVLDQVVVVGYGAQRKRSIAGAISRLGGNRRTSSRRTKSRRVERTESVRSTTYNKITPNAYIATTEQPISTLSTDVDRAAYANVRSYLNRGNLPPADAVRIEEMINYFPYARPAFTPQDPIHLNAEMITCPWNAEAKLLRVTAETPPSFAGKERPVNNLVFLIDVSGSMSAANKLPLVKTSLRMLSREFTADDRVSIVVYAGAAGRVLPPTPGNDTTAIFAALDQLRSGGSTAGGAGIQLAYKSARESFVPEGNNRVIIATDGDFNVGISSQKELVKLIEKERESGVFLTVLGFGTGNYNEGTMQELADRGNGNHGYIDGPVEARKLLVEEFGGTIRTVAKDVKLQLVFKPEFVESYRLIGYENRLLATEDFDDDTKDAAEMGAGHQVTVLYEIVPTKQYDEAHYLGTLKLRFKPAKGGRSQKIQVPIAADRLPDELATQNILWAASVAEFGMLLRDSKYKGSATYPQLLALATANLGADPGGYRKEMVTLIRKAEGLAARR